MFQMCYKIVYLIFAWLFFCSNTSYAQNDILTALNKQYNSATSTSDKIDITNKIAYEIRNQNADTALIIATKNLDLAQKEKYEFGIVAANLCIAHAHNRKGNFLLCKEYTNFAFASATNNKNDSLLGVCNLIYGSIEEDLGNFDLAIEKSLIALKYFENIKSNDGITKAKASMAQVYQVKNNLPAAEKLLEEVLESKIENKKTEIIILHTLANVYGMQENYKAAFALDKKALLICDENNLISSKSSIYDNMANCYMYSGNYIQAKEYFNKCLIIDGSFNNKKQMSDTHLNLGQLYQMQNNMPQSIHHLQLAIQLSKEAAYRQGTYQAYLLLSKSYSKNNQPDSALTAVNLGYKVKDSIINEKSENKIAELNTLYQTEKRIQELVLQKSKNTTKNWILLALIIATALLAVSSFAYFRKRNLQTKIQLQQEVLKQQDIATKAIIEAEENERKRIAAELHDGVGQMMSVAKMNLSSFENDLPFKNDGQRKSFENVIQLIDDSCKEVRNVSHQMMPNALLKSGLASAIKEFISKIDTRIIKVALHTEGLNDRLAPDVETVLYRVIQECVNNVLKHAQANHLDISIINDIDGVAVTIEDNGKGFDVTEVENVEGIGLKNIASRINYLKGTIDYSSTLNEGTIIAIHLPTQQ